MQSFASEKPREAKRRKIEHSKEKETIEDAEKDVELGNQDVVDEPEEGPETAVEGIFEEDDEDASDPFESHFADPDDNDLSKRLKAVQNDQWTTLKITLPQIGKAILRIPQTGDSEVVTIPSVSGPEGLKLKQKLAGVVIEQRPVFEVLEQTLAPLIFNYQDVLFCERSLENQENIRRLTCLHAVNHVFK